MTHLPVVTDPSNRGPETDVGRKGTNKTVPRTPSRTDWNLNVRRRHVGDRGPEQQSTT